MATQRVPEEFTNTAVSNADLSAKNLYFAQIQSDGTVDLPGADGVVNGVIQEGAATGLSTTYQFGGIAKVVTGAGVRAGQKVASDALGRAVEGSTNSPGTAITSVDSAGMVVEVQLG